MKRFIALFIVVFCSGVVEAAENRVYVLLYHSFWGKKEYQTDVSIEDLRTHLAFYRDKGFKFVSFREVASGSVTGKKNIMLTVDDGNRSFLRAYQEVFRPMGIRPLLAIYPGIIGKKQYALTWEHLAEFLNDGCDIAAHGYNHLKINDMLYNANRAAFIREIFDSKMILERRLKRRISVFVYPFGIRSAVVKATLRLAGYAYAFNIAWGPVTVPLEKNQNLYELGRYMYIDGNWRIIAGNIIKSAE